MQFDLMLEIYSDLNYIKDFKREAPRTLLYSIIKTL